MAIYPENRGWFDKLPPEKQAEFLRSEQERNAGLDAHLAEMERERMRKPAWQRDSWDEE